MRLEDNMSIAYAELAAHFQSPNAKSRAKTAVSRPEGLAESHWLTISEMAERYNTTLRTLRFYEQRGLIKPERRGSQRLYDARMEQRFRLIEQARKLDFTLTEITDILSSSDSDVELTLSKARIKEQIGYLEERHREVNEALGELRRRYYLMTEQAKETSR
jgi:DNA-binding transcriptional MerR regulator